MSRECVRAAKLSADDPEWHQSLLNRLEQSGEKLAERGGGGTEDTIKPIESDANDQSNTAKTALEALAAIKAEILARVEEK